MPDDGERRLPLRMLETGIAITVRLTPGASADEVIGVDAGADGVPYLKARVRAAPDKGKANAALIVLIAKWLGVPKSSVEIFAGGTSRLKQLAVIGSPVDLADAFGRRLERTGKGG